MILKDFGGDHSPNPITTGPITVKNAGYSPIVALRPRPDDGSRFPRPMLKTLTVDLAVTVGRLEKLKVEAVRTRDGADVAWIYSTDGHIPPPSETQINFPAGGLDAGQRVQFQVPVAHPPLGELRISGSSRAGATVEIKSSWDPGSH